MNSINSMKKKSVTSLILLMMTTSAAIPLSAQATTHNESDYKADFEAVSALSDEATFSEMSQVYFKRLKEFAHSMSQQDSIEAKTQVLNSYLNYAQTEINGQTLEKGKTYEALTSSVNHLREFAGKTYIQYAVPFATATAYWFSALKK